MASQRFALQRKLAELPQFPVTEKTAANLADAIDKINRYSTGDVAETTLGPIIQTSKGPVKMQLILAEEGIGPIDAFQLDRLDALGIGQMGRTGLQDALSNAGQIREVSFNMIDEGGVPVFRYNPITEAAAKKQIQEAGGYRQPMMEALYRMIEEQGLKPGDILKGAPIGLMDKDTRRALTYIRQGFGLPDRNTGEMYARIGRGGRLEPVQLYSPNKLVASKLGVRENVRNMFPPKQLELDLQGDEGRVNDFLANMLSNTSPNIPF